MNYNDTTNGNGIIQSCEDLCDLGFGYISGSTNNLKTFVLKAKKVMSELWFNIYNSTGSWQYDDSNNTDLPQATTDLVSGTNRYALPSDALTVNRIEIKDQNGRWVKLKVFDKNKNESAIGDLETESGTPTHYFLINGTIELLPVINYSSTGGIKVFFERAGIDFTYDDTIQNPGFSSPFHYLVPLGMSIEWLKTKQPNSPSLQEYKIDYEKGKQSLSDFYSERFRDEGTPILSCKTQNFE
jgi:hypothetical protein